MDDFMDDLGTWDDYDPFYDDPHYDENEEGY